VEHRVAVDALELCDVSGWGEPPDVGVVRGLAQRLRPARIGVDPTKDATEGAGVAGRKEDPVSSVRDEFGKRAVGGRDRWDAGGHCLGDYQAERLGPHRGNHDCRGVGDEIAARGPVKQPDQVDRRELPGPVPDLAFHRTGTGDDQPKSGIRRGLAVPSPPVHEDA